KLEIKADLCERHGVRVISDEIHMDMVWGEQPQIPGSNVARGDWALLTSGSNSFNIPALTGAYGSVDNCSSRDAYVSARQGRE
ncbi:aminotransferase class I/II-fold pyridoxal phosphate-dependent enzyme, partial [Escherichia coli]